VPVTISIGVAEKTERHAKSDQVVKAADRALYRAKEGGRNQVQV
jgi:diguanylate cyclase (GGDEF)-like protein